MNMMMGGGPMAPKSTSMAMNPRFVVMFLHGTRSKIFFKAFHSSITLSKKEDASRRFEGFSKILLFKMLFS